VLTKDGSEPSELGSAASRRWLQRMTNPKLHKKWQVARANLRHALNAVPDPEPDQKVEFDLFLQRHKEYLEHNELELALDMLVELGLLVQCRGGFWKDLERAAKTMELQNRIPFFRKQFSIALDRLGQKSQQNSAPNPSGPVR